MDFETGLASLEDKKRKMKKRPMALNQLPPGGVTTSETMGSYGDKNKTKKRLDDAFLEWKSHPVTIEVYHKVKETREALKEDLCRGIAITNDGAERTHGMVNRIIGQIAGLDQLLNLEYEDEEG